MRVVTWNVNGRRDVASQAAALVRVDADLITLQEVTRNTSQPWREALRDLGYEGIASSFDDLPLTHQVTGPRRYGELIACRGKISEPGHQGHPWPERVLYADCSFQGEAIQVWTTHIPPGSSHGWIKVDSLESLLQKTAVNSGRYRIVTGDFNTPQEELPDGRIVTWAERKRRNGEWSTVRGKARWDTAERNALTSLCDGDLCDVFRTRHGYMREDFSWIPQSGGSPIGRRFDHIFASKTLEVERCEYDHALRTAGLSDHSALVADLRFGARH